MSVCTKYMRYMLRTINSPPTHRMYDFILLIIRNDQLNRPKFSNSEKYNNFKLNYFCIITSSLN